MPETLYLSNPHSDDRFKIVQNFGPLCGDSVRSCVSTASTATKVIQMAVHAMSRHKEVSLIGCVPKTHSHSLIGPSVRMRSIH